MKKGIKRLIIIALVVGVVVGGVFIYEGVTGKAAEDAKFDTQPSTSEVTLGDITLTVSGSGNLGSADTIMVSSGSHIVLDEVLVETGDTLEAGDIIATLDAEEMTEYAQSLSAEIDDIQTQIDTKNSFSTTLSIKSTTDGWVKNVMLEEDAYIEDAMDEYGYVALIATEERELINASNSMLVEGDTVKVKCEGRSHDGVVTSENGGLYVSIDTIYRTVGADAVVYDTDGNELFTGQIELAAYEEIESNFGVITDVRFGEDDEITQGEIIYRASQYALEVQDLFEQLNNKREAYNTAVAMNETGVVTVPSTGVVADITAKDGQVCEEGTSLIAIQSTEAWIATVAVDELDIGTVQVGQRVEVSLDSMPDEVFSGEVVYISGFGSASGGITTYDVDVSIEPSEGFMLAMTLNCEIVTQQATNVLRIPVDAVRTAKGGSYVMVPTDRTAQEEQAIKQLITDGDLTSLADYMGDDATALGVRMLTDPSELLYGEVRAVETGIKDATYMEIVSGLSEGESVLLPSAGDDSSDEIMKDMGRMMQQMGGGMPQGGNFPRPNR